MNAMPSLTGSVGYIFTSCALDIKNSGDVRLKEMVDRFRVYDQPRRPEGKKEEWLAGKRVDTRGEWQGAKVQFLMSRLPVVWTVLFADETTGCSVLSTTLFYNAGRSGGNLRAT